MMLTVEGSKMDCLYCKKEMAIIRWNNKGELAFCNNFFCPKYRQPVATKHLPIADSKIALDRKCKVFARPWN